MTDVDPRAGAAPRSALTPSERRGMSWPARAVLVLLAQAGIAVDLWLGRGDSIPAFTVYVVITPLMTLLGLLVTTQAHHRLPVAWHVVVFLGWIASLMLAPWASTLGDGRGAGLDGVYVGVLAVFSLVAIEVSCALALVRPAGTSFMTVRKVEQADAR